MSGGCGYAKHASRSPILCHLFLLFVFFACPGTFIFVACCFLSGGGESGLKMQMTCKGCCHGSFALPKGWILVSTVMRWNSAGSTTWWALKGSGCHLPWPTAHSWLLATNTRRWRQIRWTATIRNWLAGTAPFRIPPRWTIGFAGNWPARVTARFLRR